MPSAESNDILNRITELQNLAADDETKIQKAKEEKAKLEAQMALLTEKLSDEFELADWDVARERLAELEKIAQQATEAAEQAFEETK